MGTSQVEKRDTANRILDVAERLVQTRGFNDVSYADIAAEVGITKASLHYHFSTKDALGDALIARYSERFFLALEAIAAQDENPRVKLTNYVDLYRSVLAADRMCLCGMLAAEYQTLPDGMRVAVLEFFDRNEAWLQDNLRGRDDDAKELNRDAARLVIDTLEGAVMIARVRNDPEHFAAVADRLLSTLAV